jgi:uncharacterized protein YgiM (DUF1202 family)
MAVVIKDYPRAYPDPLVVHSGDPLTVERRDSEWNGWLWCTRSDGKAGWVPESYLDCSGSTSRLRRDYDARELTVTVGERVTVEFEESGWLWCTNSSGESGWIPAECVDRS